MEVNSVHVRENLASQKLAGVWETWLKQSWLLLWVLKPSVVRWIDAAARAPFAVPAVRSLPVTYFVRTDASRTAEQEIGWVILRFPDFLNYFFNRDSSCNEAWECVCDF